MQKDLLTIGAATVAGGIPEDVQRGIVQVAVGLVTWLLARLLERMGKKKA